MFTHTPSDFPSRTTKLEGKHLIIGGAIALIGDPRAHDDNEPLREKANRLDMVGFDVLGSLERSRNLLTRNIHGKPGDGIRICLARRQGAFTCKTSSVRPEHMMKPQKNEFVFVIG